MQPAAYIESAPVTPWHRIGTESWLHSLTGRYSSTGETELQHICSDLLCYYCISLIVFKSLKFIAIGLQFTKYPYNNINTDGRACQGLGRHSFNKSFGTVIANLSPEQFQKTNTI